jgi:hypothetical protein
MPAKSEAQKRLMDAAAHSPAFAKKVGVPSKVAKDFSEASIGMKFKKDSAEAKPARQSSNKTQLSKGGETMDKKDMKQDKAIVKKAIGMHDKQLHGGKKTNMAKLAKGGGVETKGKTKGKMIAMCNGGMAKKK